MEDNNKKTEKPQQDTINLNEEYEVQYWASRLHISQKQLKQTLESIGANYINDIEQYLKLHQKNHTS